METGDQRTECPAAGRRMGLPGRGEGSAQGQEISQAYREAAAYLLDLPRFTKKNPMDNSRRLLAALGNPQDGFRSVHVAGTNGKGSVCAFLASILQQCGRRTGLFTSPHLVRINERFRMDGEDVGDGDFVWAFREVEQAVRRLLREEENFCHPTFFEWIFAMAAVLFRRKGMEYVVWETGMGGRLDATNTIRRPELAILTSISLDHMEILGDTVEKIAAEKAGILKPGVPAVYDAREEAPARVIEERAQALGIPLHPLKQGMYEIFVKQDKNIDFSLDTGYYVYNDIRVPSPALYQAVNASLAVMAADVLHREKGLSAPAGSSWEDTVRRGLAKARWEGRMEEILPDVYVDGGHNEAGVQAFIHTARRLRGSRPAVLLFSAVSDKDYNHMISSICEEIKPDKAVVTELAGRRCVPASRLAGIFRSHMEGEVTEEADIGQAFQTALRLKGDGVLFCVGSLYLAGEIKRRRKHDD